MSTWSFYRLADGLFTGASYSGPQDWLQINTQAGCGFLLGVYDHLSQRVDPDTGEVLDWQPPQPDDTDLQTWNWDTATKRWVATPTLLAIQASAHAAIDAEAGLARLRYITDVPGQQGVYLRKLEQAQAFVAADGQGDAPPYIAAEAQATGLDALAAAQAILAIAAQWDDVLSPAIEQARIGGKRAVDAAADAAAVRAALDTALSTLRSI